MKKQFYDHLVSFETLAIELEYIQASPEEKKHLKSLAEENVHIAVMDIVMSELSAEDKKMFLKYVHAEEHEKIWELLKEKTSDLENKITKTATELLEELRNDICEVKEN